MAPSSGLYHDIDAALRRVGLMARGGFELSDQDRVELVDLGEVAGAVALVMVGNAGPAMWGSVRLVLSYDQRPHGLDRWTRRVLEPIAARFDAEVVFPFGGPPHMPFQRWAQRAEAVFPSPIGPLIHPEYGMWHAYRGALMLRKRLELPAREAAANPCTDCIERPCLTTCPVGAFERGGYDVPACVGHLRSDAGAGCLGEGCRARRACPVGRPFIYEPLQARFHMEAFLAANARSVVGG